MHIKDADVLRGAGFRATKPRLALISLLQGSCTPLSIGEIVEKMRRTSDMVTVYRMIEACTKAGIVREVNLQGDKPRYELSDENDHHHIVCTDCGVIEDFIDETHGKIGRLVLARSKQFKAITGHSFDLYGLCNSCAK